MHPNLYARVQEHAGGLHQSERAFIRAFWRGLSPHGKSHRAKRIRRGTMGEILAVRRQKLDAYHARNMNLLGDREDE